MGKTAARRAGARDVDMGALEDVDNLPGRGAAPPNGDGLTISQALVTGHHQHKVSSSPASEAGRMARDPKSHTGGTTKSEERPSASHGLEHPRA